MTPLQSALDSAVAEVKGAPDEAEQEWLTSTTEVTRPYEDAGGNPVARTRRGDDGKAEQIILRRTTGASKGEARFLGPIAWAMADQMLAGWAPRRGAALPIEFAITFGDGQIYTGRIMVLANRRVSLAKYCRTSEAFRACFCADLDEERAATLLRFFLSQYQIGPSRSDA